METMTVKPGFYWTAATAPGDSNVEMWGAFEGVATLDWAPRDRRAGNCLALSGGGYRAAIFHLGVLRRLNELGMLGAIETIACVSGGSIMGALLAKTIQANPTWWPEKGASIPAGPWEKVFAEPTRALFNTDIRTTAVVTSTLSLRLQSAVEEIEVQLDSWLGGLVLRDLPRRPNFLFCASELSRAHYWVFGRHQIGPYLGPFALVLPDYPVARAVAASACFPPIFTPQRTNFLDYLHDARTSDSIDVDVWTPHAEKPDSYPDPRNLAPPAWVPYSIDAVSENARKYLQRVLLTDGGVIDNNGIEAVWAHADSLIVSDAGGPFAVEVKRSPNWILPRYSSMQTHFGRESQLRWLKAQRQDELPNVVITSKDFGHDVQSPAVSARLRYPQDVRRLMASVRTDMNQFERAEIETLENFGYSEAAHQLLDAMHNVPMPNAGADIAPPWSDWMDFDEATTTLRDAHKRLTFKKTLSSVPKALGHVVQRLFRW